MITEHGHSQELIEQIHIAGYQLQAHYSRKAHKWGGTSIYTQEHLQNIEIKQLKTIDHSEELVCELAAIEFKISNKKFVTISAYRPTSGKPNDFLQYLDNFLHSISTKNKNIVILGDLNINTLKESEPLKNLISILKQHNLELEKLPPTRKAVTSETSIDCCITNHLRPKTKVIDNIISDHQGIECVIETKIKTQHSKKVTTRNLSQSNMDLIKLQLAKESWQEIYSTKNPQEKLNLLIGILQYHLNSISPLQTKTILTHKKNISFTMTRDLQNLKNDTQKAKNKYLATGNLNDKNQYTSLKKTYDQQVREAKKEQVNNQISQATNPTKEIWKIINEERSKKNTMEDNNIILDMDGKRESNPQIIAESFNTYFLSIGQPEKKIIIPSKQQQTTHQNNTNNLSKFKIITEADLLQIIKTTNHNNTAGADELPGKLILHCKDIILKPLLDIINSSILTNIVPTKLKTSLVYPKFKKSDKHNIENYRPIAILPTITKYLEKAIHKQIMDYLNSQNKLHIHQHGFRNNKSINTAIADLLNFITENWEKKQHVSAVFLDLRKAFDCLNWDILLNQLEDIGITKDANKWMENYLTDRNQIVEIKSAYQNDNKQVRSQQKLMKNGVPQGSVLGPLLFLIYINTLPSKLPTYSKCIMYADDTTLIVPGQNQHEIERRINSAMEITEKELSSFNLKINHTKTYQINFTTKTTQPTDQHNENQITIVNNTKFLGLELDDTLTWNKHTEQITKKLSSALYAIKRIKLIAGKKPALTAYHSLMASHIRFGIIAWGGAPHSYLEPILILQKKAIRIINDYEINTPCRELFKEEKILTVISIYICETILYAIQNINISRSAIHQHNTRRKEDKDLPYRRLKKSQDHPQYIGTKFYNHLPQNIKSLTNNKTKFKQALINFLSHHPCYTKQEFFLINNP